MAKITIMIDGDKVTINQSTAPTKVEPITKRYFIVMAHYDEASWVDLVTENYTEAINMLTFLRQSCTDNNYSYNIQMQEDGKIIPCNGTDWDIDK